MIKFVEILNDYGVIYDSYKEELWELVKLSEFDTCKLGDIDYESDNVYINYFRNGNTDANYRNKEHKCKIVLWLLEWSTWKDGVLQSSNLEEYWDEVWVSDRYFQKLLQENNPNVTVKYVFFGGHEKFGGNPSGIEWDFVTLSYDYGTRAHKKMILSNNGYSFAPNGWGAEKLRYLAHSRWGLCLHQFGTPFCNSQRLTLFASWKLPIISDYVRDPYPYTLFPEGLVHFDPRNTICGNQKAMADAVEMNYHLVQTRTFRKEVEIACD